MAPPEAPKGYKLVWVAEEYDEQGTNFLRIEEWDDDKAAIENWVNELNKIKRIHRLAHIYIRATR